MRPINTNLYIAASILEAAGFSPLLLGTLGFLRTMYVDNNLNIFFVTDCFPSGKNSFSEHGRMPNVCLLGLLGIVALALSIYGGIIATVPSDQSKSNTFRHIGSILFAVLCGLLAAVHIVCWLHANTLMKNRRTVCFSLTYSCQLTLLTQFSHSCLSVSH